MKFPNSEVIGIDFSEVSIEWAKRYAAATTCKHLKFVTLDLMDHTRMNELGTFDFILCHAVADYVQDPNLLMKHLSNGLNEHGLIYMSVNSPKHPAKRIQAAFSSLFPEENYDHQHTTHREILSLIELIMGDSNPLKGFANSSQTYLGADIFPPICHHFSIDQWIDLAKSCHLHFGGSLDALYGLVHVPDQHLDRFYTMNKSSLSRWMAHVLDASSYQLIFTKSNNDHQIDWTDPHFFQSARPILSDALGNLPPLNEQKVFEPRPITLRFHHFPDLVISCNALELEILRQCDGKKTIQNIIDELPHKVDVASVCNIMFRAYQYGTLWL